MAQLHSISQVHWSNWAVKQKIIRSHTLKIIGDSVSYIEFLTEHRTNLKSRAKDFPLLFLSSSFLFQICEDYKRISGGKRSFLLNNSTNSLQCKYLCVQIFGHKLFFFFFSFNVKSAKEFLFSSILQACRQLR